MIEDPRALIDEAYTAYRQSHYVEAAQFYKRARDSADLLMDRATAFEAGVWEAECRFGAGRYQDALSLLLSLLADAPPHARAYDRWLAQRTAFAVFLEHKPELARLQRTLDGLAVLATQQQCPAADFAASEGDLAWSRGDWPNALHHFQRAWTDYDDERQGVIRSVHAHGAAVCALEMHQLSEAQAWRNQLAHADQDTFLSARRRLQRIDTQLALYRGDLTDLGECRDAGCGSSASLEARTHLALRGTSQAPHDDPCDSFHPARASLRKRPENRRSVHVLYNYRLVVVDYWLAALRFVAALPAVDDLYYEYPDVIPVRIEVADRASFAERLQRFDQAWHRLDQHARRLDGLLECDWRTKEAESRRKRRDLIARAIT